MATSGRGVFRSFWMGGYEGADHVNAHGVALDMGEITQHAIHAEADYRALREFGIHTVRETVGWRLVERGGRFDFSTLQSRLDAARECGMEIAWTFCHYGWPDDVDIFSDEWIGRFTRFCRNTSTFLAPFSAEAPIYTPINEISFLAWAVCEMTMIHQHRGARASDGYALKMRLVKAALAGCAAIREVEPRARMLMVDPAIHIVAPPGKEDLAEAARHERSFQFHAWDMLAGMREPQLGGHPRYLDLVGVNYYHGNQWEYETREPLHWHLNDARRVRLRDLLAEIHSRYGHPIVLSETSHVGSGRAAWMREITTEVVAALERGIPVTGVCLYPVVDRPDWERLDHWHNSGLWDLHPSGSILERRLCEPYAHELREAQRTVHAVQLRANPPPTKEAPCSPS